MPTFLNGFYDKAFYFTSCLYNNQPEAPVTYFRLSRLWPESEQSIHK